MEVLLVLVPFVLLGIGIMFVAFSGGFAAARQAYLTGGGRAFALTMVVLYLGLGVAVPALVIAGREEAQGGVGKLRTAELSEREATGKRLFQQSCSTCHNLDAVQARGVTGPDLDEIGGLDRKRVLNAIKNGGSGQGRMPALLLTGRDAEDVSLYVEKVAGQ